MLPIDSERCRRSGFSFKNTTVPEVKAVAGGPTQLRVVGARSHYLAQSETTAHFGLGAPSGNPIHELRVTFLSGREVVLSDVARNQRITVSEPPTEVPLGGAPWLAALLAATGALRLRHSIPA